MNNDDSFGCWYLHAEMELVDDDFKLVNEAPSKKCEVWLFISTTSKVMCSVLGLDVSPKDTGNEIFPRAFTLLPPKPLSGMSPRRRLQSMFMRSKVLEKNDIC